MGEYAVIALTVVHSVLHQYLSSHLPYIYNSSLIIISSYS